MKKTIWLLLFATCAPLLQAAMDDPTLAAPFNAGELDQLLRPIALYPDPLVALILPASTFPANVVLAARFVAAGGDPAAIASQPWDTSVQALAHYPPIIKWMDANLEYTQTLGEAFANQPEEVMQAIQRLRAQALASGALTNNAQQMVVQEGDYIGIEPTQPSLIYVPTYDWDAAYDMAPNEAVPWIQFGVGWAVGPWLAYECDWGHGRIWVRGRFPRWGHNGELANYRDWRKGHEPDRGGGRWRPDPHGLQLRAQAVGQALTVYARSVRQPRSFRPCPHPVWMGPRTLDASMRRGNMAIRGGPPRAISRSDHMRHEPNREDPHRSVGHRAEWRRPIRSLLIRCQFIRRQPDRAAGPPAPGPSAIDSPMRGFDIRAHEKGRSLPPSLKKEELPDLD